MKFWNRNYIMVVIGQIVSLFANNILHLALTLYVLDLMGTGYAFIVTAISLIPMVLLMPLGGILADRVNKKKIMVSLDLLSGIVVLLTLNALSSPTPVVLITLVLAVFSMIEALYTPCCQATIPFLQEQDNLVKGNAIVSQIGMGTNVIGAVIGGILYGFFGMKPILIGCALCFIASAIMEVFIIIPCVKSNSVVRGILNVVKADFNEAYAFISKEQRYILKLIPSVAVLNFAITSMLTVAVPYLTRITLGMSPAFYGTALGLISATAIIGGIVASTMSAKIKTKSLYKLLILIGLSLVPVGIGFLFTDNTTVLYLLLIVSIMVAEVSASIFSIFAVTAIELKTPAHLLGKVMSLITAVGICAEPLGRGAYGLFFEIFKDNVWIVLLTSAIFIMLFALPTKKPLAEMGNKKNS